ncbi:RND family transporter [Pseudomonadota bacterium]
MNSALYSLKFENLLFRRRKIVIGIFILITTSMLGFATQLRIDASFHKLLPLEHEFMASFLKYSKELGGANRVLVALTVDKDDIFNAEFLDILRRATDDVFFITGVDRARVSSLFTPNVRFTEVVEDGISGGNVIPANIQFDENGLERIRSNVIKAGIVGRLVANDFSGAVISVQLLETDPQTGERLNYLKVAKEFEEKIRNKYRNARASGEPVNIHIIGFAKVVGDIAEGIALVVLFFLVAFIITAFLVYVYTHSIVLTALVTSSALIAVIWQLGGLVFLGFGIDPMSILVPFLVFAIAVSHGVQMVSATRAEVYLGNDSLQAARLSFRRLLLPGAIALVSDTIGFVTIMSIDIGIIREMAITASLGVIAIIFTNLILLPVLLSYTNLGDVYRDHLKQRARKLSVIWHVLSRIAIRRNAVLVTLVAGCLFAVGLWQAVEVEIGDLHKGVPEFHQNSRYNKDVKVITERFSIGVDIISVTAETVADGCANYEIMSSIDDMVWHLQNVEGVRTVLALTVIAKIVNAGWNEGSLKWQVLPRNPQVLAQSVAHVDTSSGLLNSDCSAMPILVFAEDHKAETIARIIQAVKQFRVENKYENVKFRLAGHNVGVMAATNEAVSAAQFPILVYVYGAIVLLCLLTFRSLRGTLCVIVPLTLVSVLTYALMASLEIGLKVSTLPVVALGVGIGVDYGIYIYSRLKSILDQGTQLTQAYELTLTIAGSGVVFTGVTLAVGVLTWVFSPLKFQADMGLLLAFMFFLNMLAAIIILPALAYWSFDRRQRQAG